eukprot:scaffold319633_cov18-Tisochrysis_lutea.AAC.2
MCIHVSGTFTGEWECKLHCKSACDITFKASPYLICNVQIALRGYVSKAAAIAGAFVHLGQPVSRAANMAETAMDPADAVRSYNL